MAQRQMQPRQFEQRTQGRVQAYAILAASMMALVALACAQLGVGTWQRSGPESAWLSILGAGVLAVGAVGLFVFAVRSMRASAREARQARASRAAQARKARVSKDPPAG